MAPVLPVASLPVPDDVPELPDMPELPDEPGCEPMLPEELPDDPLVSLGVLYVPDDEPEPGVAPLPDMPLPPEDVPSRIELHAARDTAHAKRAIHLDINFSLKVIDAAQGVARAKTSHAAVK